MKHAIPYRQMLQAAAVVAAVCLALAAGCGSKHYRASADKEAYKIISHKQKAALDSDAPFSIEPDAWDPLEELPRRAQPLLPREAIELLPELAEVEPTEPPAIISLNRVMETAIRSSRDYQQRKEDIYLEALDLTMERHRWSPQFSAMLSGEWEWDDKDESWAGDADFGMTQALATGASFTLGLSADVLRYATGDPRHSASSLITARIVQPLWRGAGRRIAQENLKQAERDVVYELRSFARYHKTFAVSIVSRYYGVLRQRDTTRNEWNNYTRLQRATERASALAERGRLPEFQVDQARQDELRAKDRLLRAVQRYRLLLDQFKIELALPTDANVDVDEMDLQQLAQIGIVHPDIPADEAVNQALALRLDLATAEDRVADAGRKTEVAADGLGGDIDLVLASSSGSESNQPAHIRFSKGSYSAGLDIDLPLDRKQERNTYRRALISLDRATRDAALLTDNIKQQVRQAWRNMGEARDRYDIQRKSLELAERRVESTTLLVEFGRASTRDFLESQADLLEAQNAVTLALVDHTLARLQLWRDIGTLVVTPEHSLTERGQE